MSHRLIDRGLRELARLVIADIFIGPMERVACLPSGPIVVVANHRWGLDVVTTLLVSRALARQYKVLSSQRVARTVGLFKELFGILPVSANPLSNMKMIRTALHTPADDVALWIFPQAVWIPQTWDTRLTIPEATDRMIKMLTKSTLVVPAHIELITVRQLRSAAVVTFGDLITPSQITDCTIADVLTGLRAEAIMRLGSHCAEYRSVLHGDSLLYCGYPVDVRTIRRYARRATGAVDFSIKPTSSGWNVKVQFAQPTDELTFRKTLQGTLPGVLASRFLQHTTLEVH